MIRNRRSRRKDNSSAGIVKKNPTVQRLTATINHLLKQVKGDNANGVLNETSTKDIKDADGKTTAMFCNFKRKGKKYKRSESKEILKDVLFLYHTPIVDTMVSKEMIPKGKFLCIEVLHNEENDYLCIYFNK